MKPRKKEHIKEEDMFSRSKLISGVLGLTVLVFLVSALAYADPAVTESPDANANNPTSETEKTVIAQPQAESPSEGRALSQDEVAAFQTLADSTAQNSQVQQMNVGAGIDGTVLLTVLLALVIFAVLIAIL